mgnify:CR=1 FL=1
MGIGTSSVGAPVGQVARGNRVAPALVPWPLPPSKVEYAIEQVRGQAPDEMPIHFERRTGIARRMMHLGAMVGIGEYGHGHDIDRCGFSGYPITVHRARFAPPGDDRP